MPALAEEHHIQMTMAGQIQAVTVTTIPLIKAPQQTDQAVPLVSGHRQAAALAVLVVPAQGRCQAPSRLVTCTPTRVLLELVVAEVVLDLVLGPAQGAHTEETAGPEAPTRMEEANRLRDTADPADPVALTEDRRQVNTDLGHHHDLDQGRMDTPIIITAALVAPVVPEDTTQKEWVPSPHKLEDIQEESTLEAPQAPRASEADRDHVQDPVCRVPIEPVQRLQAKAKALRVLMCIVRVLYRARLQHRRASLVKHRANRVPQRLKIWASHRVNRMVIA